MNAQSGYTVVSYTAEETHVSLTLMPYGPGCPSLALDLQLCDASGAALGDGAHASIVTTRTSDHYTGEITVEIDCAAGEADFTQAAGLRFVRWPETTLDEAAAVTVALP